MPPPDPPPLSFILIDTLSTVFELVSVVLSTDLKIPSLLEVSVVVPLMIDVSFLFNYHN